MSARSLPGIGLAVLAIGLILPSCDSSGSRLSFPADFLWGAASSAHQIEGNNTNSDLWDWETRFEERSGLAANSYVLYDQDAELARTLNLDVYRFSIEWARVEPARDTWSDEAIAHYRDVLTSLIRRGIRPAVTLHHFTNPKWIYDIGPDPWESPEMVEEFEEYARRMAHEFGARVDLWMPWNEPNVYAVGAYGLGRFPPGRFGLLSPTEKLVPVVMRNVIEAHIRAYRAIHETDKIDADGDGAAALVGVAQSTMAVEPADPAQPDHVVAADRWARFWNWLFLDAVARGDFDEDLALDEDVDRPDWAGSLDFVGVNYYSRMKVLPQPGLMGPLAVLPCFSDDQVSAVAAVIGTLGCPEPTLEKTDTGWEIYPEGFRDVVLQAWRRYGLPIVVTENGIADAAGDKRASYTLRHLEALHQAMEEGADVRGYWYWSLIDNYEWGSFKPRFGLFRVEYENDFRRVLTPGGEVYAEVAESDSIP
ncbi:MAG: glycoside hydrolase family 1 protein [Nitrospirae bacterium]|nr:glycoside hydrolase family 1 protein [Nitrospirota bacterium]